MKPAPIPPVGPERPQIPPLRWLTAVLAVSAILAAGCAPHQSPEAEEESRTVQAQTATVAIREVDEVVEATGMIEPLLEATLASKVVARVTEVRVRPGDTVRKGQVLVVLDAREMNASVGVASANVTASRAGLNGAVTAEEIERQTSSARVVQAEAAVRQAEAAKAQAEANLALVLEGPRDQERQQAALAVQLAKSNLDLAETELNRTRRLVEGGALALRALDQATNAYEVAQAQYDSALEAQKIAEEGSRTQEVQAARDAVAQAEAHLEQAEAALVTAQAATGQVDLRQADIRAARAQVAQAEAALDAAQVGLGYATIVAPFDGRVVERHADPGAMAALGVPLLEIEGGSLRLQVMVPERIVGALSVGDAIAVRVDALSEDSLEATVEEIVPASEPGSFSFTVRLGLGETSAAKSGMFGRAEFVVGRQEAIVVPRRAILEELGLSYATIVNEEGIARRRVVTLGRVLGDEVIVLSGLREGERFVVENPAEVRDGDRVE